MSKYNRTIYIKEGIVAFLIVTLPFMIFLHLLFSETDDYIMFFNYAYHHNYLSAQAFVWTFLTLLTQIILLTIWFFECSYRWKWFILAPLTFRLSYFLKHVFTYPKIIEEHITLFTLFIITIYLVLIMLLSKYLHLGYLQKHSITSLGTNSILLSKNTISSILKFRATKKNYKYIPLTDLVHLESTLSEEIKKHVKVERNSIFALDLLIILMLICSAILVYVHLLIPENKSFIHIFNFKIGSAGFTEVQIMVYVLSNKAANFLYLLIWFVTSYKWYKYALLSPILMTAYQIWELFQPYKIIDEYSLLTLLPWIVGLSAVLVFIGVKVNYVNLIIDYQKEISTKIDELITKNAKAFTPQEKESLSHINGVGYHKTDKFNKLEELLKLKQQLEDKLKK